MTSSDTSLAGLTTMPDDELHDVLVHLSLERLRSYGPRRQAIASVIDRALEEMSRRREASLC